MEPLSYLCLAIFATVPMDMARALAFLVIILNLLFVPTVGKREEEEIKFKIIFKIKRAAVWFGHIRIKPSVAQRGQSWTPMKKGTDLPCLRLHGGVRMSQEVTRPYPN